MQIFISSPNLIFDKDSDLILLTPSNIELVKQSDIVIGSATFMDELILDSLIDRGVFPFAVTLDKQTLISPTFRAMTLTIEVNSYTVTDSLIDKIVKVKESLIGLEKHIVEVEQKKVQELLLNYLFLLSFSLDSSLKGEPKEDIDEWEDNIFIFEKSMPHNNRKIIYIFLYEDRELKIFKQEEKLDFEVNKRKIRNYFSKNFRRLMREHQQSSDEYKNITLQHSKKFRLLEKIEDGYELLSAVPTDNYTILLDENINLEEVVVYPTVERKKEIDQEEMKFLISIANHFNLGEEAKVEDIRPLLMIRNLYDAYHDKHQYQTIVSEVFHKFIEKINETKEEKSSFDLSIELLKSNFENIKEDKAILTNILYSIESGINIQRIVKKQFGNYMSNFLEYKKSVKLAEKYIEDEGEFTHIIDFLEETPLNLNQRVNEKGYIYNLIRCLSDENSLKKEVKNLYKKLLELNLPSHIDYEEEYGLDAHEFLKKNDENRDHKQFIQLMIGSIFRMQNGYQLSAKKLSKLMAYIFIQLSQEPNSHEKCFLSFSHIYADNQSTNFLLYLHQFFQTKKHEVERYFRAIDDYSCHVLDKNLIITTQYGEEHIQEKTLEKREERATSSLKIIGEFYRLLSGEEDMNAIISNVTHKIVKNSTDVSPLCQQEITTLYLGLFLSSKKHCEVSLKSFFDGFKEEYELR